MRSMLRFVCAAAVLFWLIPAQAADESAAQTQIRQIDKEWQTAFSTRDPKAIAQFYMENGVLLAPGAPMAQGREAIADAWKSTIMELKNFHLEFAPTKIEVASSGDLAYEIGTYSLAYQDEDNEQVHDRGKYVVVWKKADGSWKAAADIFNTDEDQ
jgi:uncharacterized protein (TIGR02246 family)